MTQWGSAVTVTAPAATRWRSDPTLKAPSGSPVASLYLKHTDDFCCHVKKGCLQTLKPEFLLKF